MADNRKIGVILRTKNWKTKNKLAKSFRILGRLIGLTKVLFQSSEINYWVGYTITRYPLNVMNFYTCFFRVVV